MDQTNPVVLVTGGSGMLGRALIERLHHDYRVVSLDLKGDPGSPIDVEFVCVDLTSDDSVRRAVERIALVYGSDVASLVHLAAYYDFSGAPSPLYDKVTVEGTARLLDAIKALQLEQFVFSSTMLVHRPTLPGRPIDENQPLAPAWAYPESKRRTEHLIRQWDTRVPVAILRLAGVYTEEGDSPPLTNQVMRIHGRWPTSHFYPASLRRGQSFVHRDDAVDALARTVACRRELPEESVFLVGEPTTLGYGDVQDLISRELFGTPWRTHRLPAQMVKLGAWLREKNPFGREPFERPWMVERAGDHYELDISRARDLLGWEPRHSLRDVVPEMVRRLRDDPTAWYAHNHLDPPRRVAT